MRSALKLLTLALLCVTVYCLPGPDPGAYHFTKTVWVAEKGASSPALKIGEFQILKVGNFLYEPEAIYGLKARGCGILAIFVTASRLSVQNLSFNFRFFTFQV